MNHDILINNLINGEPVIVTKPDGTTFTDPRPPTRTMLAAARALQNLHQQLANNQNLINQLSNEQHQMWHTLEQVRQQNEKLENELKSLRSFKTSDGTE